MSSIKEFSMSKQIINQTDNYILDETGRKICFVFKVGEHILNNIIMQYSYYGKRKRYLCQCELCGKTRYVFETDLLNNKIKKCSGCNGIESRYKFNIVDVINGLEIVDRFIRTLGNGRKVRCYKCKCIEHGHITDKIEDNLVAGKKCGVCTCEITVKDVNSISVRAPWMIDYFVNKEDAYKYAPCSNKKISMRCPYCGIPVGLRTISNLYLQKAIECPLCSDGHSVPEKFVYALLMELKVDVTPQKTFHWAPNKKYDFFIPSLNMIIEAHGMQHYEKFNNSYFVLEEEQKNDKIKRELAVNNGIDYYIEMDCRYSDLSWLMDNTIKSLSGLFDLSSIDFSEIYKKAVKHHIVSIIELLNDGKTVPEISKTIGLAKNTIYRRIKTMRDLDVYSLSKYNIGEVR